MVRTLFFVVFSLFFVANAVGQTRTIKGKVTSSEDNQGIPGANVVVQGTSRGISTDMDGVYSIDLGPGENTLVFTFVGFKSQSVDVGQRDVVDVVLEPEAKQLEEVVVVGYGQQRKTDVTGATATVKGDVLMKQPVLTATQALQGQVAGVQIISSGQPGSSPQIRVRGVSTALGETVALYVVDNVLTNDISNINTADIVDINVLKDASAAAIYGSRGANGVIIITTKRGSGGLKINYHNNIGIRQAANLVKMANAAEYRNYVQAATGSAPPPSSYDTDWYGTILRNAFQQNHALSLSGGADKVSYLFNVGYLKEDGIVLNNDFKRLTLRFNSDYKLSDHVKVGFQSSYGNSVNQNGFGNINIDPNGNVGSVYNDAYRAAPIIADKVDGRYGNSSTYQNVGNPLLDVNNNSIQVKENRLQGTAFMEVKPLSWITLKSSLGGDLSDMDKRGYYYKFLNDDNTFLIAGGNQYNTRSSLSVNQSHTFKWVWDNIFTINKKFGDHEVTFMGGTTAEKFHFSSFSASRKDVPADPSLWYIGVGDANSSTNEGGGDEWARNSYIGRLNYSFQQKYLLTATVRRDGTSRLPEENRWRTYPSVGLGWIISREAFMDNQKIFDFLKLRASYGKVGNDQIRTDAFRALLELNKPYPYSGINGPASNGSQQNQFKDLSITWEDTEEYDLAMEFSALQSKLTGEVNYYNKKVINSLIYKRLLDNVTYDIDHIFLTNAAVVQNKGLEISLGWKDKIKENFSYTISGNVTFNKNEVTKLNGGVPLYDGGIGAGQGLVTLTDVREPVGSFYVLKVIGVFNTAAEVAAYKDADGNIIQPSANPGDFKYYDKNKDGAIDDKDRVFAGSYQPVAYFGLNLGVNFKNWDLGLSFYGNLGNKVYNGKKAVRVAGTDNVERDVVYDRWTPSNRSQSEPAANSGNLPASTYFVESGSFVRINNLTLGYTFPTSLLQKIKVSSFRIFATSQNLLTLKKYSGFTAELPGSPTNSGIELTSYPTTRTIAMGVNIGF